MTTGDNGNRKCCHPLKPSKINGLRGVGDKVTTKTYRVEKIYNNRVHAHCPVCVFCLGRGKVLSPCHPSPSNPVKSTGSEVTTKEKSVVTRCHPLSPCLGYGRLPSKGGTDMRWLIKWLCNRFDCLEYLGCPRDCRWCELLGICRSRETGWRCEHGCLLPSKTDHKSNVTGEDIGVKKT